MESGLRARRISARPTSKPRGERLNAVELLMFGLIGVALVDCTVIGWLVAHGLSIGPSP